MMMLQSLRYSTDLNGFDDADLEGLEEEDLEGLFSSIAHIAGAVVHVAAVAASAAAVIPGVGTVAGSVLGGIDAVAHGESITKIGLAAMRGAIPGGPIVGMAFDAGLALAHGESVASVALGAIRAQVPGGDLGKAAFDQALSLATSGVPEAQMQSARAALPIRQRAGFDAGWAAHHGHALARAAAHGGAPQPVIDEHAAKMLAAHAAANANRAQRRRLKAHLAANDHRAAAREAKAIVQSSAAKKKKIAIGAAVGTSALAALGVALKFLV